MLADGEEPLGAAARLCRLGGKAWAVRDVEWVWGGHVCSSALWIRAWLRRGFEARIGVTFSPTFCTAQTQSIRSPVSAKYPASVSRSAAGTSSGVGSSGQLTPLPPPLE